MLPLLLTALAHAQDAELPPPPDAPPVIDPQAFEVAAGEPLDAFLSAWDPEGSPVTITVSDLPEGATFDPLSNEVLWTPGRADVGEHRFTIHASDGVHTADGRGIVDVVPRSWVAGMVPGVGWGVQTIGGGTPYQGPIFDLELVEFGQPGDQDGPSHGRVYGDVGLLRTLDGEDRILTYGAGFGLSLEPAAGRRLLIPYAGAEIGNVKPTDAPGALFLAPHLGLWLYTDGQVAVDAQCGYAYALREIDAFSGTRCTGAVHWSTW